MNASENTRNLLRTNSENLDFRALVHLLDQDLAIRDGEDHAFYDQFNKIDKIAHALVAFEGGQPIGCGAIRAYAPTIMEVKRMFVLPAYRGKGVAAAILIELERWAAELGYTHCRLETGKKQPEAIGLYQKSGYTLIPNYGPYEQAENSVCMEKSLG